MRSDVCLILEGTYPYVAGGVSTWVQQILEAMPQFQFSILFIGPKKDMPREFKYHVPENVVDIKEVFVHDYPHMEFESEPDRLLEDNQWEQLTNFTADIIRGKSLDLKTVVPIVESFRDDEEFMRATNHSLGSWNMVRQLYNEFAGNDVSFLDFFWTFRFINIPLLNLLRIKIPRARVYHSACTGYAGLLGAKAAICNGSPLLLTEHGIYTRERRIEIFSAEWIRDISSVTTSLDLRRKDNFFKDLWVQLFLSLSKTAYDASSHIFSLFDMNKQSQVLDGANGDIIDIIPNGINIGAYSKINPRRRSDPKETFNIGFVGRVTAIKDIKTLIRAFDILNRRGISFFVYIMGPMDEEPEYASECRELVTALGLQNMVEFTGRVKIMDYFDKLDVVVLTSVSEGLPFVILEANCAGIPCVATNVGACRDLVTGATQEDRELGPSGLVTRVGTPSSTADALEMLATDPQLQASMGDVGRLRVQRFYDINDVMDKYREAYETYFYRNGITTINPPK